MRALQEMKADLQKDEAMNRLVQGDVGSGKTILAVILLLMTATNGYQGALMAPTEVLAVQHYETFANVGTVSDPDRAPDRFDKGKGEAGNLQKTGKS